MSISFTRKFAKIVMVGQFPSRLVKFYQKVSENCHTATIF